MTSASGTQRNGVQYVTQRPSFVQRIVAAIVHLLLLAGLPGILATLIIFLLSRTAAPYVRYHAKMALRWQLLGNLVFFGIIGLLLLIIVAAGFGGGGQNGGMALDAGYLAGLGFLIIISVSAIISLLLFGIPALIGAIVALFGGTFRYPLVTRRPRPAPATPAPATPTSGRE